MTSQEVLIIGSKIHPGYADGPSLQVNYMYICTCVHSAAGTKSPTWNKALKGVCG